MPEELRNRIKFLLGLLLRNRGHLRDFRYYLGNSHIGFGRLNNLHRFRSSLGFHLRFNLLRTDIDDLRLRRILLDRQLRVRQVLNGGLRLLYFSVWRELLQLRGYDLDDLLRMCLPLLQLLIAMTLLLALRRNENILLRLGPPFFLISDLNRQLLRFLRIQNPSWLLLLPPRLRWSLLLLRPSLLLLSGFDRLVPPRSNIIVLAICGGFLRPLNLLGPPLRGFSLLESLWLPLNWLGPLLRGFSLLKSFLQGDVLSRNRVARLSSEESGTRRRFNSSYLFKVLRSGIKRFRMHLLQCRWQQCPYYRLPLRLLLLFSKVSRVLHSMDIIRRSSSSLVLMTMVAAFSWLLGGTLLLVLVLPVLLRLLVRLVSVIRPSSLLITASVWSMELVRLRLPVCVPLVLVAWLAVRGLLLLLLWMVLLALLWVLPPVRRVALVIYKGLESCCG